MIAKAVPQCAVCHKTMDEFVPLRDVSEQVKLLVFPIEVVQTPKRLGTIQQQFDVLLRGWHYILLKSFFFALTIELQMIWPTSM